MRNYLYRTALILLCIILISGRSDTISIDCTDNISIDCPAIPFHEISAVSVVNGQNGQMFTIDNNTSVETIIDEIRSYTQLKGSPADNSMNGYLYTLKLIDNRGTPIETICLISTHSVRVGEVVLSVYCGNLSDYLSAFES